MAPLFPGCPVQPSFPTFLCLSPFADHRLDQPSGLADRETESQKRKAICSGSHSERVATPGQGPLPSSSARQGSFLFSLLLPPSRCRNLSVLPNSFRGIHPSSEGLNGGPSVLATRGGVHLIPRVARNVQQHPGYNSLWLPQALSSVKRAQLGGPGQRKAGRSLLPGPAPGAERTHPLTHPRAPISSPVLFWGRPDEFET